jgi:hypothetical protein
MEGGDLGMLAGPRGYEYACTTKPGPGALWSLLQSWILGWIFREPREARPCIPCGEDALSLRPLSATRSEFGADIVAYLFAWTDRCELLSSVC